MSFKKIGICCLSSLALAFSLLPVYAEDYRQEREEARRELAPYFRKEVAIQSALVESTGPEWIEKLGARYRLVGCPEQPIRQADATKELIFRTAGPGPWVGAVDGINIEIKNPDGRVGGSVAYPSNSTARLPDDNKNGPKYEFFFDETLNVRRALVDAAIAAFDRCFSKLPPGRFTSDELDRLCPYRPVSRDQQRQTCVVSTNGTIGRPLIDGIGYEVEVNESTLCDFVGISRSGDTNTSFTTCFNNTYKGVATLSAQIAPLTAKQKLLRSARSRISRMCTKSRSGRRLRNPKMQECVVSQMSKVMAGNRS
jgi:hypothetical protein